MEIKEQILELLYDKLTCPNCEKDRLYVGQASIEFKEIPVLFCSECQYRITIIMIENDPYIARSMML